jgi:hypothetical protein
MGESKKLTPRKREPRQAEFKSKSKARWAVNNVDIKKWKPIYEQMVQLNTVGYTAEQIQGFLRAAGGRSYSLANIYKVLSSKQANEYRAGLSMKLRSQMENVANMQLDVLAQRAVENIATVLHSDKLREENPFAVFDRSMAVIRGLGKMTGDVAKPSQTNINVGVGVTIQGKAAENIADGMAKSDAALQHLIGGGKDG